MPACVVLELHVLDAVAVLVPEPHGRVEARLDVGQHRVVRVTLDDLQPRVIGGHVQRGGDLAQPSPVGDVDAAVGEGLCLLVVERHRVLDKREHLTRRQDRVVHGPGGHLHVELAVGVRVPEKVRLVLPDDLLGLVLLDLGRGDLGLGSRPLGEGYPSAHALERPVEVGESPLLVEHLPFSGLLDLDLAGVGHYKAGVLRFPVELGGGPVQGAGGGPLVVAGLEVDPHPSKVSPRDLREALQDVPPAPDGVSLVHGGRGVGPHAELLAAQGEPLLPGAESNLLEGSGGVALHDPAGFLRGHPAHVDGADADAALDLIPAEQRVQGDEPGQQDADGQRDEREATPAGVARPPALPLRGGRIPAVGSAGGARSALPAYLFQVFAPPATPTRVAALLPGSLPVAVTRRR